MSPVFAAVHVAPLFVERKTPPLAIAGPTIGSSPLSVPAYRVVGALGLMARDVTLMPVRPVFVTVQWSPLSTERKTLLPPAYKVVGVRGLMAREETVLLVRPVFTAVQVVPLSLEGRRHHTTSQHTG